MEKIGRIIISQDAILQGPLLAAILIMVQESQARLPSMPKQSFRAALGAVRAETKLQEKMREETGGIQTHGREKIFTCWRSSCPSEDLWKLGCFNHFYLLRTLSALYLSILSLF